MRVSRHLWGTCLLASLLLLSCDTRQPDNPLPVETIAGLKLLSPAGDSVRVLGGDQPFTFVFATAFSAGITREELPKLERIMTLVPDSLLRLVVIVLDPREGLPKLDLLAPSTLERAVVLLDPLAERRYIRAMNGSGFPVWQLFDHEGALLHRRADQLSTVQRIVLGTTSDSVPEGPD